MRSGKAAALPADTDTVTWSHAPGDTAAGCSLQAVLKISPPVGATGFSVHATFRGRPSALSFEIGEVYERLDAGTYGRAYW